MNTQKEIKLTPENIPEVIVTNPMTARCIFQKGMEYNEKHKHGGYALTAEYLEPRLVVQEPINEYGNWGYRYADGDHYRAQYVRSHSNFQRWFNEHRLSNQ